MGLDMHLTARKSFYSEQPEKQDGFPVKAIELDLGYWRKHPDLHGFIVQAFAGGKDECQDIWLSAQDIRNIISAVKSGRLPHTEGFFFGSSERSKRRRDEDLRIFEAALHWLESAPVRPKVKKTEFAGGEMHHIEVDQPWPTEFRDVVYRAWW